VSDRWLFLSVMLVSSRRASSRLSAFAAGAMLAVQVAHHSTGNAQVRGRFRFRGGLWEHVQDHANSLHSLRDHARHCQHLTVIEVSRLG